MSETDGVYFAPVMVTVVVVTAYAALSGPLVLLAVLPGVLLMGYLAMVDYHAALNNG